jgi:hypothetical protein
MNDQVNDPLRTRREFCEQGKFGPRTLQRIEARGDGPPPGKLNSVGLSASSDRQRHKPLSNVRLRLNAASGIKTISQKLRLGLLVRTKNGKWPI